ncbi:LysR family transcriptional regulator [Xylophilus sp. Kf1]|nr:LysR family transcriptional regulator [Xylophilus sp. Kf1]
MLKVPPLNPLRVFEVVARTGNLTTAAVELNVSQSAVSRQIGVLEAYLGMQLFHRERLGVILTAAGAEYAQQIGPAFQAIARATEKVTRGGQAEPLRVRAYTTFTAKWLIPHLPEFKQNCPDLDIAISNAVPDVDFSRDPVDVAIQFGDGQWPDVQVDLLFDDEIEPVCSPDYLARHQGSGEAGAAMLRERLLVSRYRRTDWDDWLAATGHDITAETAERMIFSSSVLTWQAALDGLGMAIGQTCLLQAELDSGRLVRPFARPLRRHSRGHYLVRSSKQRYSPRVERFRDWIIAAVARDRLPAR